MHTFPLFFFLTMYFAVSISPTIVTTSMITLGCVNYDKQRIDNLNKLIYSQVLRLYSEYIESYITKHPP